MANHHILDSQGVDISHQDSWHVLTTETLPDGIASVDLTLLELLQRQEKPDVLVPLADLLDASGTLGVGLVKEVYELIIQHSSHTGLWVTADTDTDALIALSELLLTQTLIVIHVPKFADGRNFSFAQTLRQIGYQGEIRVTGDFGRDQIAYLLRVGVDSFVLSEHDMQSISDIRQAFNALASSYGGRDAAALPMFAGV
ncbi:MAG: DUF934 domain-containing protein [Psychrobacter sp.]|uniref:DUF934 domain-containing protein n=1 Tax=unclassified Psychrobacter TaxID=196806 RepID=UPI001787DC77|nr:MULTISPECIES: DUF934 domain-containing protein [unclassified Psychrobacter]MBE0441755.1 DUF934 domain-containing protein [Psychrobacter sp. FME13]